MATTNINDVERMLERHPDIAQAAVVPIDDEIKGQKPVAFVVPKPGRSPGARSAPTARTLRTWARSTSGAESARSARSAKAIAGSPVVAATGKSAIAGMDAVAPTVAATIVNRVFRAAWQWRNGRQIKLSISEASINSAQSGSFG